MDAPFGDPTTDVEVVPLDAYLEETGRPVDLVDPHAWQVNDDGAAEWAMGKLRRLREQAAEVAARAKAFRDPIDEWERRALGQLNPGIAWFEGRLVDYLRALRAADDRPEAKRPKSHGLPSGQVWSRAGTISVEVVDGPGFLAWALLNERYDLLNITPSLAKLRAHAQGHADGSVSVVVEGEPVPGVVAHRKDRTWGVTVAKSDRVEVYRRGGTALANYPAGPSHPPTTMGTEYPPTEEATQ